MITKKIYEEIKEAGLTQYVLQLGDFIIAGMVADDPNADITWCTFCGVSARRREGNLEKYPEDKGREAGPEYERIFQMIINEPGNIAYWKYLGKYGRKAAEYNKKNPTVQCTMPGRFDRYYKSIPYDVKKFNIQPMEDDEEGS